MPREAKIFRVQVFQGLPAVFLAPIYSLQTGELLTAADVASITYELFDVEGESPSTPIAEGTVTVAQALHAVKRDARWSEDNIGYNFDHLIPGSVFPTSGKTYVLRYLFTAIGDASPSVALVFSVYVLSTRG